MRRILACLPIVPVLFFCLAIFLLASCTPQWAPDSSGFVYSKLDGSIFYYDFEKEESREVAAAASSGPVVSTINTMGFSPDGKKIGLARLLAKDEGVHVKFVIYSLDGNFSKSRELRPRETKLKGLRGPEQLQLVV